MKQKLILTRKQNHYESYLFEDDQLVELRIDQNSQYRVGDIYIAKVKQVVKNIEACFVELNQKQKAYLSFRDCFDGIPIEGQEIMVQIVKEGLKTKDPVVTTEISIPHSYMVFSYQNKKMGISEKISDKEERERLKSIFESRKSDAYGLILRTNAANIAEEELIKEFENGERQFLTLIQNQNHRTCYSILYHAPSPFLELIRDIAVDSSLEIITDDMEIHQEIEVSGFLSSHLNATLRLYEDSSFPLSKLYCLERKQKEALSKKVWLPSGGYLIIEQTEAMVVIDVNTGKYSGKKSKEETFFFINLEAAKEIARQIRLRNLSGILMIDFINMKEDSKKQELIKALKNYVSKDKVKTVVVDITSLGLVEVTRKKIRKTLAEQAFQTEEDEE